MSTLWPDTHPDMERLQVERLRQMPAWRKMALMVEMSESVRTLALAGLRQLFARHYDGQGGRSTATAAVWAWVEAIGALGDYYHRQFIEGNREVIQFLALEEANLLQAHRTARRHGSATVSARWASACPPSATS